MTGDVTSGIIFGFNPRAHEGRDADMLLECSGIMGFNPRAHEGRDHVNQ